MEKANGEKMGKSLKPRLGWALFKESSCGSFKRFVLLFSVCVCMCTTCVPGVHGGWGGGRSEEDTRFPMELEFCL